MGDRSDLSFSVDNTLGRLARWLRLLGHDSSWDPERPLREALARARAEGRVLLTRSRELERAGLSPPPAGYLRVDSGHPREQLNEVGAHWPIFDDARPFTLCSRCNGVLEEAEPTWARARVPPFVARTQERFRFCPGCSQVYWGATHAEAMVRFLGSIAHRLGQEIPLGVR